MRYSVDVRRGHSPYGVTTNHLRVWVSGTTTCTVDVDLDDGSILDGTYADATVTALGATADDGYRIQLWTSAHTVGGSLIMGPLVSGSNTFRDNDGSGYYYAKDTAAAEQRRISAWTDCRGGEYTDEWVQTTDAARPIVCETDGVLRFSGTQYASCHALAALGGAGAATPFTVAAVFRKNAGAGAQFAWAFRNSANATVEQELGYRESPNRLTFDRVRDDGNYQKSQQTLDPPFEGVAICRYDGSTLRMQLNGVDATPASHDGNLTADNLWLGTRGAAAEYRLNGSFAAFALWDSSLSDAATAAAYRYLDAGWGY
jgi:hypothetical protein